MCSNIIVSQNATVALADDYFDEDFSESESDRESNSNLASRDRNMDSTHTSLEGLVQNMRLYEEQSSYEEHQHG